MMTTEFVCRYKPESQTMELSCRGGQWVSSDAVACMPVECGQPSMPNAAVSCVHGTTFGQKCTFHCQPPSSLHGTPACIRQIFVSQLYTHFVRQSLRLPGNMTV